MKIKKNDTVLILTGKDKGKTGKVLAAMPKSGKVKVDGINIQKKHKKPRSASDVGGIMDQLGAIDASNAMVVCDSCKKATRVAHKVEAGKKFRICKKCGAVLDKAVAKEDKKTDKKTAKSTDKAEKTVKTAEKAEKTVKTAEKTQKQTETAQAAKKPAAKKPAAKAPAKAAEEKDNASAEKKPAVKKPAAKAPAKATDEKDGAPAAKKPAVKNPTKKSAEKEQGGGN